MASRRARISADGQRDLALIFSRTTADWGIDQARRYRRALKATCERIGDFPKIGTVEPDLEGIRSFPSGQHRILYEETDTGVLILRIIHQAMRLADVDLP